MSELLTYLDYASAPQDIKDTARGLVDSFIMDSDLLKGAIVAALLRERPSSKNEEQALVIRELVEALKPFASASDWPLHDLEPTRPVHCRVYPLDNPDGHWIAGFGFGVKEFQDARAAIAKAKQP